MFTNEVLKSRIEQAANIIRPFFKETDPVQAIDNILQKLGIDDTDLGIQILESAAVSIDDVEKLKSSIVAISVIPGPRLKIMLLILKGIDPFKQKEVEMPHNVDVVSVVMKQLEMQKPIGQWSDTDLLHKYDKDTSFEIVEELRKRSKDRPCIVFFDYNNKKIDIDTSLVLLRQARYALTPSTFEVAGKICKVYAVGEFPMDVLYECPVHSNVLLTDGYCEECGIKWPNFEKNKKKYAFIRLMSQIEKVQPTAIRAYSEDDSEDRYILEELKSHYPKIMLKFQELEETDSLPVMKRRLSSTKNGDPFRVIHKQY
jgi:hypothetical protein